MTNGQYLYLKRHMDCLCDRITVLEETLETAIDMLQAHTEPEPELTIEDIKALYLGPDLAYTSTFPFSLEGE